MRAIPRHRVIRPRDIHAAARRHGFGQRHALRHILPVLAALRSVGIHHVFPRAHFGDDHVLRGKGLHNLPIPRLVLYLRVRAVSRTVAQAAMLARQFGGVVTLLENRAAQPDWPPGSPRGTPCRQYGGSAEESSSRRNHATILLLLPLVRRAGKPCGAGWYPAAGWHPAYLSSLGKEISRSLV